MRGLLESLVLLAFAILAMVSMWLLLKTLGGDVWLSRWVISVTTISALCAAGRVEDLMERRSGTGSCQA